MIVYEGAKLHPRLLVKFDGSVFPFSCMVAVPGAVLCLLLKLYGEWEFSDDQPMILGLQDPEAVTGHAWSAVSSLLGFLVVFRTSQAYSRFWEGCGAVHQMVGEWFDASSSLIAFCKLSGGDKKDVVLFQHTLVRLVSLLNAVVLMDLATGGNSAGATATNRAFELELIDAEGIDRHSLMAINTSDEKVELIFHWIQQLIVENIQRGIFSVQPPIMSRAFQELANGMVRYHDAMKIARIPLPFPYMQTIELLLVLHWLVCPFLTCMWTKTALWGFVLTFMQIFFFWSLNCIACELENPFGEDVNDLPAQEMQMSVNKRLLLLLRPSTQRTARLSEEATLDENPESEGLGRRAAIGKRGVKTAPPPKPAAWLSRRISLGCLQEAIDDEAIIEIETIHESEDGDITQSKSNSARSVEPHFRIREKVRPSRTCSLERMGGVESGPRDGTGTLADLCSRTRSRHSSLKSVEVDRDVRLALRPNFEERLLQTGDVHAQHLQDLVNICEELRQTAREASRDLARSIVIGKMPRSPDGGSPRSVAHKIPGGGCPLPDPGGGTLLPPSAGAHRRNSLGRSFKPPSAPANVSVCCSARLAGDSQKIPP
mmetsp:Transcript_22554/g.64980  ORF Transcript_22554/g.64980 Transcript_22554/m.64980 type:complete len:599 (+) Transcript_22554:100-1896(+)